MGRVAAYFTVGGCQVLKPCRGLVSFCFMYLVHPGIFSFSVVSGC